MAKWIGLLCGVFLAVTIVDLWARIFHDPAIRAERWLLPVFHVQDSIAQAENSGGADDQSRSNLAGRVVFVAGSSSLFGIDGSTISALTGREVISLGTHAALSADFLLDRAERIVRPGDIVVAGFELEPYVTQSYSTWEQEQAAIWRDVDYGLCCGYEHFLITWQTSLEILGRVALARVVAGPHPSPGVSADQAVAEWREALNADPSTRRSFFYSPLYLDEHGAFYVELPSSGQGLEAREDHRRHAGITSPMSQRFLSRLTTARRRIEQAGASFIIVPPPIMEDSRGEFNALEGSRASFEDKLEALSQLGFDVRCGLADGLFPPEAFLDTQYHLNAWGSTMRALRLSRCIFGVGREVDPAAFATGGMESNRLWLEILRFKGLRGELHDWELPLLDLLELAEALENYHDANGSYPRSEGWDGIRTSWGRQTEEWISGLAPEFIDELPVAQSETQDYLYRSDGENYKLILSARSLIETVHMISPGFVDPKRSEFAISVSSSRQNTRDW